MTRRFLRSLSHALRGIRYVWQEEANFKVQTTVAFLVIICLIVFQFSYSESAIILFAMMLVLGAEMFNTLVEDLLNVIEPEHHRSVGRMKDMMAGIVLLLSLCAGIIGVLVFLHHFEIILY